MNTSLHRRGCSLSSLESFGGDGLDDEDFLNDQLSDRIYNSFFPPPPPPSEGQETPRPLRRRLGAEEAIMAISSPEIKALDLPLTPAGFPRRQKHRNTLQNRKTQSAPNVIEIHNDFPMSPPPKKLAENNNKENIDPQRPRQSLATLVKRRSVNKMALRNRSNLVPRKDNDTTKGRNDKLQKVPSHRRLSVDSLPSPEDLCGSDGNSDIRESLDPRPAREQDKRRSLRGKSDGTICRLKVPFRARNMNVMTGFR